MVEPLGPVGAQVQAYIRLLSAQTRRSRFHGGMSELPERLLERFVHVAGPDRFTMLATMIVDGLEAIVGEACYAFDTDTSRVEVALSIDDRWQRCGIGRALLRQLEDCAAAAGAVSIFGDASQSNARLRYFAHASGYAVAPSPDWRAIRLEKEMLGPSCPGGIGRS